MLHEQDIKSIEIFEDSITESVNKAIMEHSSLRKRNDLFLIALVACIKKELITYSHSVEVFPKIGDHFYISADKYLDEIYNSHLKDVHSNEVYKKMMIRINETELATLIKLCFRKNEFVYLGDIALCSPMLLCRLKDYQREWQIPIRKELLKNGLDLCTKLKIWPFVRKELSK